MDKLSECSIIINDRSGGGTFNSSSMFRVRMMELAKETESPILIKRVVKKRIEEAKMLRDKVLDLKNGKNECV